MKSKNAPTGGLSHRIYFIITCVLGVWVFTGCGLTKPVAITPTPTKFIPQVTLVSLTFDDGNADNFPVAAVLKQYGLHATFYIPSGLVGKNGFMTWEQLQSLQNDGNEIGGHTLDHIKLGGLDLATLRHEICDDRKNLIDHGLNPISFSYPFGNFDDQVSQIVKECGYANARTILGGPQRMPLPNPYALLAFPYIVNDTGLPKLEAYVGGTRREGGGWVIFIFHHVCDSCDFFSVKPQILNDYIPWLAAQQSAHHIKVLTMGEEVPGTTSP